MAKNLEQAQAAMHYRQRGRYRKETMIVHDHFDGSAHCVQCNGMCQQAGQERAITELIRGIFEDAAMRYPSKVLENTPAAWLSDWIEKPIYKLGVDVIQFRHRAIMAMDFVNKTKAGKR